MCNNPASNGRGLHPQYWPDVKTSWRGGRCTKAINCQVLLPHKKRPREGAVSNSKSDDKSVAQIMRLNARRAEQDNVIAALANGGGEAEAVVARLIGEAFRAIYRHQNRAGQTRQHNAAIF